MTQVQNVQGTISFGPLFGAYILREYEAARNMREEMDREELAREQELFQVIDDYVEQA